MKSRAGHAQIPAPCHCDDALDMRWLAALTFVVVSLVALAARTIQPALSNLPNPLSLALPPLETAPLTVALTPDLMPTPRPSAYPLAASQTRETRQVSLLLAGDTGLNSSFQPVLAGFALRYGTRTPFDAATQDIAPLISADISFANLETVITDRNELSATPKMFGFRTHPDGVRELMRIGFNLFSTANNHALDYGPQGAAETLRHLDALGAAHAGLGHDGGAAAAPAMIERRGVRVALGAIGIGGSGFASSTPGRDHAGQLPFNDRNMDRVVSSLSASASDIRILSVHYGTEFNVWTSAAERQRFRQALEQGADIVAGHHQHVAAGIELIDGKAIFYGLGNFLHLGTQNMGRHGMCHDYGLVARLHLSGPEGGALKVRAIEAIPIMDMHVRPRLMGAQAAAERIHVLNYLAAQFGDAGVRFAIEPDGTGLHCAAGADALVGSIGVRCATGRKPEVPSAEVSRRIEAACARRIVRAPPPADRGGLPMVAP